MPHQYSLHVNVPGTVWFAQTNTGNIANFEPSTGTFTEFENEAWPESGRSMIWGMDYSPDGSMWYTDEAYDTIWRFSILDETYSRIAYSDTDTFPQKIEVDGSSLIINDFTKRFYWGEDIFHRSDYTKRHIFSIYEHTITT